MRPFDPPQRHTVRLAPDGQVVAWLEGGQVHWLDLDEGRTLNRPAGGATQLGFPSSSTVMVVGPGLVRLWERKGGLRTDLPAEAPVIALVATCPYREGYALLEVSPNKLLRGELMLVHERGGVPEAVFQREDWEDVLVGPGLDVFATTRRVEGRVELVRPATGAVLASYDEEAALRTRWLMAGPEAALGILPEGTMALVQVGEQGRRVLARDPERDLIDLSLLDWHVHAVASGTGPRRWHPLTEGARQVLPHAVALDGELVQLQPCRRPGRWLCCHALPGGRRWRVLDDGAQSWTLAERDGPLGEAAVPVTLEARDGLSLHGLWLSPPEPHGTVVLVPPLWQPLPVAGGPHAAWLVSQGYRVLVIAPRGATGRGASFQDAGDGQSGEGIPLDVVDAARWAAQHGSLPVGMGMASGGYLAMRAVALAPDAFAGAVNLMGPLELATARDQLAEAPLGLASFARRLGPRQALVEQAVTAVARPVCWLTGGKRDLRGKEAFLAQLPAGSVHHEFADLAQVLEGEQATRQGLACVAGFLEAQAPG